MYMVEKFLVLIFSLSIITLKAEEPISKLQKLKVDGVYLKDSQNQEVVLRGVSYGWSNEHYRFYNESTVGWLKSDWNVSVVRATIGIEPENGYLQSPLQTTHYITQLIDGAIKNNVYIVLAWHCNNRHLDQSKDFFAHIAKKYGKYPNIIYELFTEPDDETWSELKPYYAELIQTIRLFDQSNVILLSAPYWSQSIKTVADDPLTGFENIMYTIHFCTGESGQTLRNDCKYALEKGIPLIVSDHLLTDCTCDGTLFVEEWEKWIFWFEQNKISWIVWSISDKKENCSLLVQGADTTGNWKETDLNESGKIVRAKLKKEK